MAIKGRKTAMSAEDNKIGGLNVYHDEKGRPVYLNRMNHVGYVLTDKTKPFRTYSSRFFIGGIAAIFAYMFELPLIMCIFLMKVNLFIICIQHMMKMVSLLIMVLKVFMLMEK